MKNVLGIAAAVFLLAGALTGCGSSATEESESATETTAETQVTTTRLDSEDGWGSTISKMGTDSGNFTKLKCGMSAVDAADLGYGSKERYQNFTQNEHAQTMDHILYFYADGVTSFDYAGTPTEIGTAPQDNKPYSAYVDLSVNGDTGELYAARYMIGVSEEDADTAGALADALFEQYDNGSGEQKTEHGYLIPDCEPFNGTVVIYYGENDDGQAAFIFRIYNEDYNDAPDFYENGNFKKAE